MKLLALFLLVLTLLIAPAARAVLAEDGWEPLGPPGGEIGQLLVNPRNPQILWASPFPHGVYKSVDGGASWRPANGGLREQDLAVRSLAVAPSDPRVLYLASGDPVRIYRSSDGGATWTVMLPCGDQPPPCCGCVPMARLVELVVHPRNPQTVFAASGRGLFKSVDGGVRWRSVTQAFSVTYTLVFDPRDANVLYAGSDQGLFKSTNGGTSWRRWGDAGGEVFPVLVIDPRDSRRMWAASSRGVFRSTNGGAHWTLRRFAPLEGTVAALALSSAPGAGLPTVWAGTLRGVYRSLDGGLTWSPTLPNHAVSALATHPSQPAILWIGTHSNFRRFPLGIYKSVNRGASWSFSSRGIFHLPATSVAFDPVTPDVVWAAANGSVYRSFNGGATWADRSGNLPSLEEFGARELAIDPNDPRTVWAGTTRGVFVTEDAGITWEPRREGLTGGGGAFPLVRLLRLAPSNPSIAYAATFSELFRTVDAGAHWTLISSPPPDLPNTLGVEDLLVDPRDPDVVFATLGSLWRSDDGGNSWTAVLKGSGEQAVHKVAADPRDPDLLYAAGGGGVFRSADGGQSWQQVRDLQITAQGDVAVGPEGEVWAGGRDVGVYFSPDGISGWTFLPGLELLTLQLEADPHHPETVIAVTTNFAAGAEEGLFRHVGE